MSMKTSISGQCATKMLPKAPWRAERCWLLVGARDPGPGAGEVTIARRCAAAGCAGNYNVKNAWMAIKLMPPLETGGFWHFSSGLPHSFEDRDRRRNGETNHGCGQAAVQMTEKRWAVSQSMQCKTSYNKLSSGASGAGGL